MKRFVKIVFISALVMGALNTASAQDDDVYYSSKDKKATPVETKYTSTIDASKATPVPAPTGNEVYDMGSNNIATPNQGEQVGNANGQQGTTYETNNYYEDNYDSYGYRLHRYHSYYDPYYDPWYTPAWGISYGYGFGWGISYGFGYPYYGYYAPYYVYPGYYGYYGYPYGNYGYAGRTYYGSRNGLNGYGRDYNNTVGGGYAMRGAASTNTPRGGIAGSSPAVASPRGVASSSAMNAASPRDFSSASNSRGLTTAAPRNLSASMANARVLEPRNNMEPMNRGGMNNGRTNANYNPSRGGYNSSPRNVESAPQRSGWNNSRSSYEAPHQQAPMNSSPQRGYSAPSSAPRGGGGYSAPSGGGGRSSGGGGGSRGGGRR